MQKATRTPWYNQSKIAPEGVYSHKSLSFLGMAEGFIGAWLLILVGHGDIIVVGRVRGGVTVLGLLRPEGRVGGADGLIGVGGLLRSDAAAGVVAVLVAVGRAAGAAAGAEHPEDGGSQRERDREPSSDVYVLTQVYLHTVDLEGCAEGALCDGEHDG